jgi:hypothetical protein
VTANEREKRAPAWARYLLTALRYLVLLAQFLAALFGHPWSWH